MLLAFNFSKICFLIASNVGEISMLFLPIHTFWCRNSAIKSLLLSRGIIISLHRNLLQVIPSSLKLMYQLMVSKEKKKSGQWPNPNSNTTHYSLKATLPITAQVCKAKQTPSPPAQSALVSSKAESSPNANICCAGVLYNIWHQSSNFVISPRSNNFLCATARQCLSKPTSRPSSARRWKGCIEFSAPQPLGLQDAERAACEAVGSRTHKCSGVLKRCAGHAYWMMTMRL